MTRKYALDPVLEKQYDVRLLRNDFMDVYQGWCDTSAEFRRNADMDENLAYGENDRHRLDVFRCNLNRRSRAASQHKTDAANP